MAKKHQIQYQEMVRPAQEKPRIADFTDHSDHTD